MKQVECLCGWSGTRDECDRRDHNGSGKAVDVVFHCPECDGILDTLGGKQVF